MMERAARYSPSDYMFFLDFNDELRSSTYPSGDIAIETRFRGSDIHQDLEHSMHGQQQKKR